MKKSVYFKILSAFAVFAVVLSMTVLTTIAIDLSDSVAPKTSVNLVVSDLDELQVESVVLSKSSSGDDYEMPFVPVEKEHVWDEGVVTKEPSCTENGVRTYTCIYNITHKKTVRINATGHTSGQMVVENEVVPTCCETGSCDEVFYCSVCETEISRVNKTLSVDENAHDWGEWYQTVDPTLTQPGEQTRTCKLNSVHIETNVLPPLLSEPYTFFDGEVIIATTVGAVQDNAYFDVQKITPPPSSIVDDVEAERGSDSSVLSYYEIRFYDGNGQVVTNLDSDIVIKTKMTQKYVDSHFIKVFQKDESGRLIMMKSWWEDDYLCYTTNWLENYN